MTCRGLMSRLLRTTHPVDVKRLAGRHWGMDFEDHHDEAGECHADPCPYCRRHEDDELDPDEDA